MQDNVTYVEWYLAWHEDNTSKRFRLFLISQQKEFTVADVEGNLQESKLPLNDKVVFKKPLIETDLGSRLKYFIHLNHFVFAFTDYLKNYRKSIDCVNFSLENGIPF